MKKEIIQKIDLLVEMSGTTNNYETLNEELGSLNQEIEEQKRIIRNLKKTLSDKKYLKANEKIIDENIKIGLENRLETLTLELNSLKEEILDVSKTEVLCHEEIVSLDTELKHLNHFLESLNLKMKTVGGQDKENYNFYEKLISNTEEEISTLKTLREVKQKKYSEITKNLDDLGNKREILEDKIKKDEMNLTEINLSLENPESYIDINARTNDKVAVDNALKNLEYVEKRRLEILTDPAYIGHEATMLYMDDDRTSALNKVKELVTIIQTKPYMETYNRDLEELLENAVSKRDEFANFIENNKYDIMDLSLMNVRMQYLEKSSEEKMNEKIRLEELIKAIDTEKVKNLVTYVDDAKKCREELRNNIEEYEEVIKSHSDLKTPKKNASLNSALKLKMEELKQVEEILSSFETDLENTVIESKKLEEEQIAKLNSEIKEMKEEINHLQKLMMLHTRTKDILAVEKDKETLKNLNDDVQNILNRKKYSQTPMEIYDEIELALGSMADEVMEEKESTPSFVNLEDYKITFDERSLEEAKETQIEIEEPEVVSEPEIPEPVEVEDTLEIFSEPVIEEEVKEIPPRETNLSETARLKVVNIEPIEEEKKENTLEALPEDDFMINDFQDTDYISFNELLESDNNETQS